MLFSRFVVLMVAGASLALASDVRVVEEIAVKVNGDIITRGELEEQRREMEMYLRQEQKLTGNQLQTALSEQSKDLLRDKIDELLLVQKAKDLNVSVDSEVNRRLAQMQVESKITDPEKFHDYVRQATGISFEEFRAKLTNSYLTHRVISQEVGSRIAIPEADLRQYYDEHKSEFVRQEQVYLSQILISTEGKTPEQVANAEKKAKDIVARARKGEKFSELAQANSDDPETAKNGGQLPPRQRGMSLKAIDDIVFTQKKGYVTDPIKVASGFVILKIDERYEAGQAPFEDVKDQIQERLAEPKMTPKLRELLSKLRQQAFLEIKDGYVDSGAVPGKDTRWHDVAVLKPQTTTKEEVQARAHRKRFLGVIPHGQKVKKTEIDTSTLGAPKEPAKEPAKEPPAPAPVKQQ
jgi:peptidyl-prolyl cis-trans isomerase SurA